jgi:glutamine---fructose-6-phosphate transaminase (isomerizing)
MCGIIGFIGFHPCFRYGINGLKQLQNRGYDSAGVCGYDIEKKEFVTDKFASTEHEILGDVHNSISLVENCEQFYGNCSSGIFHTRWATHGAKTDINAHPHLDHTGKIALVHNGIIENCIELRNELEEKYNIFSKSETDTEVIVNLISVSYEEIKRTRGTNKMEEAIMTAVNKLSGTWALVIMSIDYPDVIYCIRHGSPLLIGINDDYAIVTSEQAGFCNNVPNYFCMNSDNILSLRKENGKILFDNMENYTMRELSITNNELSPFPYSHWTLKEINEQYDASLRAISFGGRIGEDTVKLGGLVDKANILLNIEHIMLIGCGTSYNAAEYCVQYFTDLCDVTTVGAFDGSEFDEIFIPKRGKTCAIFISQSGETRDLYRCLSICKNKNVFTIGVINVVDSLIAREVDCGCYLNAGREVGVASTKAFTSQIIVISMISIFFSQLKNINETKRNEYLKDLKKLPCDILKITSTFQNECEVISKYLLGQRHMFVLGKGQMLSTAHEGALKIKEIGYLHAEAFGGKALRHGPYALIENGTPIVFLIPEDSNKHMMNDSVQEVISRNAYTIIISDFITPTKPNSHIMIPKNSTYKGILHNIPMQFIAYNLAVLKGHNPDMPKNLSKCVSV